jgi:copper chaperone CopZ
VLRFEISGMHCDGCANGLTAELRQTPGVTAAQVKFSNQLAAITCDTNHLPPDGLVKVIKEAGFTAKRLQP